MELKDKVILITGASSGIGAAAARLFASEGAKVVLGARRDAELRTLATDIRTSGGAAAVLPGDVGDPQYAKALVDKAISEFGALHGAFNNAGMVGDMAPVTDMADEMWHQVITTNLTSAFYAAKAQVPALLASGGGAMVFTSSFVGNYNGGLPGMGAYAASKAGMIGLMKSLAIDHAAEGLRINAILPGGTQTPMAGEEAETLDFIAGLHPMKRMASAQEIAQSALFLLSERASFITGASIAVDGGVGVRFL